MRIIWKYWLLVAIYYFINHQNPCFSPHRMQQWFIFHSRACAFFFHWHAVSLHQEILPRTCIRLVKMIQKINKKTLNYEKEEKLLLKFCFTRYAVSCTFFRWSGYVLVCSRFPAKKSHKETVRIGKEITDRSILSDSTARLCSKSRIFRVTEIPSEVDVTKMNPPAIRE